jgi:hypothetical protein
LLIAESLIKFNLVHRKIFCNNKLFHCWPPLNICWRPA